MVQRFRVALDRVLGGRVQRAVRRRQETQNRADVDDPTAALRSQIRQHLTGQPHQAEEVGVEQLLSLGDRTLLGGAEDPDSGVVDQNVDAPRPLDDRRHGRGDRRGVGDVERDQLHARGRLGALRVAAGAEDLEAFRREGACDGLTDSRRDAGNQHHGRSLCHIHS